MGVSTFQSLQADFSTSALRSYTQSQFCASDYRSEANTSIYETSFGGVRLGAVGVFRHSGRGAFYGYRRLDHIRSDHIDDYLISLPLQGSVTLSQLGVDVLAQPGLFLITAMEHPLTCTVQAAPESGGFDAFHVIVSGSLLRAQTPYIDECCRRPIKVASGSGKIMATLFMLAIQESGELSEAECRRLDHMLVDSVANALSAVRVSSLAHSRSGRLIERAMHYINSTLSDPALCPQTVAAHCNVSVSYLHRAFASESLKFSAVLRETRLIRARESLRNPELMHQSVSEIAQRWGFADAAYFCRAYRAQFSRTPTEDRRDARRQLA